MNAPAGERNHTRLRELEYRETFPHGIGFNMQKGKWFQGENMKKLIFAIATAAILSIGSWGQTAAPVTPAPSAAPSERHEGRVERRHHRRVHHRHARRERRRHHRAA